jgi:hypothetical protein
LLELLSANAIPRNETIPQIPLPPITRKPIIIECDDDQPPPPLVRIEHVPFTTADYRNSRH